MLWLIFFVLLLLWVIGWGFGMAGKFIHVLLILALIVALLNLFVASENVRC